MYIRFLFNLNFIDADTCTEDCAANANCTNNGGNRTCICNSGCTGNGTVCEDETQLLLSIKQS